jgi:hypothetical protein
VANAISFDLRGDKQQIAARLERFGRSGGVSLVLQRTLNRVVPSVRSAATKALVAELGAQPKFVANSTRLRRASRRNLSAALQADVKQIPLIAFKARQVRKGVTYQIGRQPRTLLEHAYINRGSSTGKRNVFRRVRTDAQFNVAGRLLESGSGDDLVGRYPTLIRYGPSVARALLLDHVQRIMSTTFRERWDREIEAQLRHYLSQNGMSLDG